MARIAGVDLPREKRVEIGLTYIYGIGRPSSQRILKEANVDPDTRVKDLTDDEVKRLAIREHLPVVLETDDRAKEGMYEHFGFSLVQTRTLACGVHYYEMIWRGVGSPAVNLQ